MGIVHKIMAKVQRVGEPGDFVDEVPIDKLVMADQGDLNAETARPGSSREKPPKPRTPKRRKP